MSDGNLKLRATVADHAATIAVVLIVLAMVGGYVTYGTHVDPDTTVEERQVSSWESTGAFEHRSVVTNGTEAFPQGTVLENRSTYFRGVNPTLNGSFVYEYGASDSGDLEANASTVLVIRSVADEGTGDETEHWRVEEPLGNETVDSLSPGERVRAPFSVDISEVERRANEIDSQLGATPGERDVVIEARLDLSGTRNGVTIDRTRTHRLSMTIEPGVYRVDDPGIAHDSGGRDQREVVPASYGPIRSVGGPLLAVLSLVGLSGLFVSKKSGILRVSDRGRERLAFEREREEFDEWISAARMPDTVLPDDPIELTSLRDLVDLAIDTNQRVLEIDDETRYAVLHDGNVYVYEPPEQETYLGLEEKMESVPESALDSSLTSAPAEGAESGEAEIERMPAPGASADKRADRVDERDDTGTVSPSENDSGTRNDVPEEPVRNEFDEEDDETIEEQRDPTN